MADELVDEARPAERVAVLTLQRPTKKNALSIALHDEFTAWLSELRSYESVSVVVVTGAEGAFSAGFDLDEFGGLGDPAHGSGDPPIHSIGCCWNIRFRSLRQWREWRTHADLISRCCAICEWWGGRRALRIPRSRSATSCMAHCASLSAAL